MKIRQIFKKFKEIISIHPLLFIFLFSFFYLMIWIPFGIDMTDEGKQMSIAWNIFHGKFKHTYDVTRFGSWFINGLWLCIVNKPLLLWARIGGVVLMSFMTLFVYLILSKYSNDIYSIFVIVVTLLLVICENHPETKIDHSNLPVLFAFIFLAFIFKGSKSKNIFTFIISNIFAYIFLILSIWTRLPHLLFLPFPFIYYLFESAKSKNKDILQFNLFFHVPIFMLFSLIVLIFFITNFNLVISLFQKIQFNLISFKNFIFNFNLSNILDFNSSKQYSYLVFLFHRYLRDTIYITVIALIIFFSVLFAEKIYSLRVIKLFDKRKFFIFFNIITTLVIFLSFFIKPWFWYMSIFAFVNVYLLMLILNKIKLKEEFFYIFWGYLLFFVSFVGSNNSYRHSFPAGAIFLLIPIVALINHKRKSELRVKLPILNTVTYLFFIAILLFSFTKKIVDDNKRDTHPIFTRNVFFKSSPLFGITSNRERVVVIDDLISTFNKISKNEDTILCFNSIPMMYYFLNKDYFLNDPWLIPYGKEKVEKELEAKAKENIFPNFIIFSKTTPQEDNWPNTNVIIYEKDKKLYEYILSYINRYNYKEAYQNSAFVIYKR